MEPKAIQEEARKQAFKETIAEYLAQKDRPEAWLARRVGCSATRFNKWVAGDNRIPYDVVQQICDILKLDKLQQIDLFDLAGYPLPSWVKNLAMAEYHSGSVDDTYELIIDLSIVGHYEGESQNYLPTEEGIQPIPGTEHIEQFSITRTTHGARIVGTSFDKETKKLMSTWSGHIFKVEADNTLCFGIELQQNEKEFGVFTFRYTNGLVQGWYHSAKVNSRVVYSYQARKVNTFSDI